MNVVSPVDSLIGYFHEDWQTEYGEPEFVLEDFVRGEPELAPALRSSVTLLLTNHGTEESLTEHFLSSGFGYRISAGGWTSHREWLLAATARVEELLRLQ